MFGSEKEKNGYTLMVQMYFALQINQKRRTGMNSISEKELLALNDLLGEEELLTKSLRCLQTMQKTRKLRINLNRFQKDTRNILIPFTSSLAKTK